jgi:excisionase family DNA binding protein
MSTPATKATEATKGGEPGASVAYVASVAQGNGASGRLPTAYELAERWQVRPSHVYRLTRDGVLPTVRLGRYVRYRLEAVDQFERDRGLT